MMPSIVYIEEAQEFIVQYIKEEILPHENSCVFLSLSCNTTTEIINEHRNSLPPWILGIYHTCKWEHILAMDTFIWHLNYSQLRMLTSHLPPPESLHNSIPYTCTPHPANFRRQLKFGTLFTLIFGLLGHQVVALMDCVCIYMCEFMCVCIIYMYINFVVCK